MNTLSTNQDDTMFKFVSNDPSVLTGKRKQTQRACETCRKRKKRCHHDDAEPSETAEQGLSKIDSSLLSQSSRTTSADVVRSDHHWSPNTNGLHQSPATSAPSVAREPANTIQQPSPSSSERLQSDGNHDRIGSEALNSRFVGDLNPESIFLAATSPGATRGASSDDGVGVWLAKALTSKWLQPTSEFPGPSQSSMFYGSVSLLPKVLFPVLEEEALSTLPPIPNVVALSTFYFEKLHPIIPLIDTDDFYNLLTADPRRVLLQQGICLAASKSFNFSQHLILPGSDSPLAYREFGDRLSAAMRLLLELGIVTDKIVRIQAFAFMAHFTDGPDVADVASQLLGRAVQHTMSLGLHLEGHRQRDADSYGITLFCSLWALDRMNAAFGGRPVMMHDRDIGRDLTKCFQAQEPYFSLLLEVTLLLDKVIGLYRPSKGEEVSGPEFDFPSFEELVTRCTGSHVATHFLATIETFYNAVAMLSYRSKTWDNPQRSSSSYLRQCLASSRMSTISSQEVRDQLILFPFVPYAFSLSLSVAYREMRHSKVAMNRARARTQFQSNCDVLSELGGIFSSASTMAEMGKSTLKEMDRVFSVVAVSEQRKSQPVSRNVERNTNGTVPPEDNGSSMSFPKYTPLYEPKLLAHAGKALGTHESALAIQAQDVAQPMPEFDPSLFDSMSDMDLFGMFDPAFDLNSLDALLEGNLDLSFPTHFQ